jgi:hypothetical protein
VILSASNISARPCDAAIRTLLACCSRYSTSFLWECEHPCTPTPTIAPSGDADVLIRAIRKPGGVCRGEGASAAIPARRIFRYSAYLSYARISPSYLPPERIQFVRWWSLSASPPPPKDSRRDTKSSFHFEISRAFQWSAKNAVKGQLVCAWCGVCVFARQVVPWYLAICGFTQWLWLVAKPALVEQTRVGLVMLSY